MNVHISYKVHKTPDIEKEVTHLLDKLRRRLQVFRPELIHLKGMVEQNSPREGTTVSLNLRLPSGQMAAQQSSSTAKAAVKVAFDDLLQQVTKHKDQLRNPHKWPRRRSGNGKTARQVPFEQTLAAVQPPTASADDVRSYVNANLGRLSLFVERELYFREAADQISPEAVSKEEVVDEAVARALGDGGDKPERLALEPWLYRLAIGAMDDLAAGAGHEGTNVHLEDSVRPRNVRASDEAELQFHQPDETMTEETVIADPRVSTPEDLAASAEMMTLVQFALGPASRSEREAFLLHALEGFSVEEVSAITGHSPDRVRSSIAAARAQLRRSSPLAKRFPERAVRQPGGA
jgi:DNA-directed RNA polymerase specialized sigma24 family protein/ribosome-associated translation inhibitor RaiA